MHFEHMRKAEGGVDRLEEVVRASGSSDELVLLLRRGKDMSASSCGRRQAGQRTLLADCDPQGYASEMFITEPEIEFDSRSIIADPIPTENLNDVVKPRRRGWAARY